jgi:hypothetical protein
MTRAEFIQQLILRSWDDSQIASIKASVVIADALEKSGEAPWAGSEIDNFTTEARADEREECAKIAEWYAYEHGSAAVGPHAKAVENVVKDVAMSIRSRCTAREVGGVKQATDLRGGFIGGDGKVDKSGRVL